MTDNINLTGVVATVPRVISTSSGLAITSFRLASSQRRYDRTKNTWVDGETNWYTVNTFRSLADHVAVSVVKGDRVVVGGRLRIRPWEKDGKTGTAVEVDAEALGHDLFWGTGVFTRASPAAHQVAPSAPEQSAPEPNPSAWSQPLPGEASTEPSWSLPGTSIMTDETLDAPADALIAVPGGAIASSSASVFVSHSAGDAPESPGDAPDQADGHVRADPGEPAWAVEQTDAPF